MRDAPKVKNSLILNYLPYLARAVTRLGVVLIAWQL